MSFLDQHIDKIAASISGIGSLFFTADTASKILVGIAVGACTFLVHKGMQWTWDKLAKRGK